MICNHEKLNPFPEGISNYDLWMKRIMSEAIINIPLPESTYRKLQRAAEMTYSTVSDILRDAIESSLPTMPDVPRALGEELTAMRLFSDDALWAAANPSISAAEQARLAQLNQLAGERTLTAPEAAEQDSLLKAYDSSVLRRAQALAILSQRGHAITADSLPLPQ